MSARVKALRAELERVRSERDRYKRHADALAHVAGTAILRLDSTFLLPTVAGWDSDVEDLRQVIESPAPVYDRLVAEFADAGGFGHGVV